MRTGPPNGTLSPSVTRTLHQSRDECIVADLALRRAGGVCSGSRVGARVGGCVLHWCAGSRIVVSCANPWEWTKLLTTEEDARRGMRIAGGISVGLLAKGAFDVLETMTSGRHRSADELRSAVEVLDQPLVETPDWEWSHIALTPSAGDCPEGFDYAGLAADGLVSFTDDPTDTSIGRWIEDYPARLVDLPAEAWDYSEHGAWVNAPGSWWVIVDLWTAEESRSDLSMEATVWDDGTAIVVKVDNVHVM